MLVLTLLTLLHPSQFVCVFVCVCAHVLCENLVFVRLLFFSLKFTLPFAVMSHHFINQNETASTITTTFTTVVMLGLMLLLSLLLLLFILVPVLAMWVLYPLFWASFLFIIIPNKQ